MHAGKVERRRTKDSQKHLPPKQSQGSLLPAELSSSPPSYADLTGNIVRDSSWHERRNSTRLALTLVCRFTFPRREGLDPRWHNLRKEPFSDNNKTYWPQNSWCRKSVHSRIQPAQPLPMDASGLWEAGTQSSDWHAILQRTSFLGIFSSGHQTHLCQRRSAKVNWTEPQPNLIPARATTQHKLVPETLGVQEAVASVPLLYPT